MNKEIIQKEIIIPKGISLDELDSFLDTDDFLIQNEEPIMVEEVKISFE